MRCKHVDIFSLFAPYVATFGKIVATGAGAGLVLDFVGFVRANKITPKRPVKVCYSSASLALLQFVTNTLLTERTPGIQVETALTRHEELEVSYGQGGRRRCKGRLAVQLDPRGRLKRRDAGELCRYGPVMFPTHFGRILSRAHAPCCRS